MALPFRLGRLPHNPSAVAAAPSLPQALVMDQPPVVLQRKQITFPIGMYGNDWAPDCTAAALANGMRTVAALNNYPLTIEPDDVPAFYADVVGVPDTHAAIAASDGAEALDVLHYQFHQGFDIGGGTTEKGVYATVPLNGLTKTAIANCIFRMGFAYIGVVLKEADMDGPLTGTWDISKDEGQIAGGHMISGVAYDGMADDAPLYVTTWGVRKPATWRWLMDRMEEAHVVMWKTIGTPQGQNWMGLDWNRQLELCNQFNKL